MPRMNGSERTTEDPWHRGGKKGLKVDCKGKDEHPKPAGGGVRDAQMSSAVCPCSDSQHTTVIREQYANRGVSARGLTTG